MCWQLVLGYSDVARKGWFWENFERGGREVDREEGFDCLIPRHPLRRGCERSWDPASSRAFRFVGMITGSYSGYFPSICAMLKLIESFISVLMSLIFLTFASIFVSGKLNPPPLEDLLLSTKVKVPLKVPFSKWLNQATDALFANEKRLSFNSNQNYFLATREPSLA